jgi:hypothetical protein
VVTIPSLTSDWLSAAYNVTAGVGDNDDRQFINGNMNVNGLGLSVADFGTTQTFTNVGVFRPNRPLDPSGLTPNLSLPIATSSTVVTTGTPRFTFQYFPTTTEGDIPTGDTTAVAAVQFPVGDPGLLGIGCDSTASGTGNCGFTQDNFATPTIVASFLDMGINIGQDNTSTTSCKQADRKPHGRLRCQTVGSAGGGSSVGTGIDAMVSGARSGLASAKIEAGSRFKASTSKPVSVNSYFRTSSLACTSRRCSTGCQSSVRTTSSAFLMVFIANGPMGAVTSVKALLPSGNCCSMTSSVF